jgi:hypothetical protein
LKEGASSTTARGDEEMEEGWRMFLIWKEWNGVGENVNWWWCAPKSRGEPTWGFHFVKLRKVGT